MGAWDDRNAQPADNSPEAVARRQATLERARQAGRLIEPPERAKRIA